MTSRKTLAGESDGSQPVVLVVDDNPGMRSAIERVLKVAGLSVELYASGSEFLQSARLDRIWAKICR